jgi:hypothetical protein
MMPPVAAIASPFSCRWIQSGSEARVSNWSRALCIRIRERPRIVTEDECARCALWEPRPDGAPDRR